MEFQVYSVVLEDRFPRGLRDGDSALDVLSEDFPDSADGGVCVEKKKPGCVAFVFGRSADGKSVCARVQGVRPKLYFKLSGTDTLEALRIELCRELGPHGREGLKIEPREFAHDYGYEPDDTAPSGRRLHPYVEVSYPSKVAWHAAVRLRRDAMLREVRERIAEATTEVTDLSTRLQTARGDALVGSGVDAAEYARRQARLEHLQQTLLPGLRERVASLRSDDAPVEPEEAVVSGVGPPHAPPRAAQEYFVEPLTRFLQEANVRPSRWVAVPMHGVPKHRISVCDIEVDVDVGDFRPVECDLDAPYTVLNFDIETLGLEPRDSPVIQISLVFVTRGERERHLVALGSVAPISGVIVHACSSEAELLHTFRVLLVQRDPDFVVAYNGVNFDNAFLATRASTGLALAAGPVPDFLYLSRFALRPARLRELRLSSSGMGDNLLRFFDMPGRVNLDYYVKLKRDLTSEPMYTLNYFARKFCGLQKEDMDYREIPVLQAGSAEDRARLGSYCVKDSELCEDLNEARTMITEILQFSAVFGVLPEWVYFRGQQVRFVAQLLSAARTSEAVPLLLNRPPGGFHGEGTVTFQGATVNDPKRGFYRKAPVATLDWASLYPSIMCAHNLCHSTHVLDPKAVEGLSGIVAFDLGGGEVVRFATAARHKGILPRILEDLGGRRKVAKRRVKECAQAAKDPACSEEEQRRFLALSKVFDGQQLALKVSMNSMYGVCGAMASGKFPDLAISKTVTLQGRTAMEIKKAILPVRFPGIDVIYGDTDSVMVTFADAHDVQSCGERGEEASAFVTEHFASLGYPEMRLEFEKCFFPYLLEGKKRYAGLKFEMDVHGVMVCKGIDCKGIETERRDTLPFVKDIMHGCLNILMHQRDEELAFAHFRQRMREFVAGEIPFDKFVMRKNLSAKAERKPDQLVQARVNALRRSRAPGSEAAVNEQVEYVIVNGWKGEKTTQLAEDPQFAREQGLKLNLLWYFEHAIVEPVRKLFAPLRGIDFEGTCKIISLELDSRRLGVSSIVRDLLSGEMPASTPSASAEGAGAAAGTSHIPCFIPSRKKPRRPPRK